MNFFPPSLFYLYKGLEKPMIACSRCGRWHLDPEKVDGKRLSCTEVKRYWAKVRKEHLRLTGHAAQITTDESGNWICLKCNGRLLS
jgi:hypothetical protein